ncbi:hypothetical protein GCM10011608_44210 [Micromonospora sonchi]|uniref:Uncharacterized protein n=1 Tax=Micromonospora sonchi TaxID=1763543 RepID=A0A917U4G4_9ACTN|nr:hypothetical protein GCM10011608_44210 [Micromonospora sonchi]
MRVHRTDLVSFAFGLLFLTFAAWWLLAQMLGLVLPPVGWFLAGGLILIGGLGLVGALRSSRYATQPETPKSTTPQPETPKSTMPQPETPEPNAADLSRSEESAPEPDPTSWPGAERTLDLSSEDEPPPPGQRGSAA